jgi:hypothetical protein
MRSRDFCELPGSQLNIHFFSVTNVSSLTYFIHLALQLV